MAAMLVDESEAVDIECLPSSSLSSKSVSLVASGSWADDVTDGSSIPADTVAVVSSGSRIEEEEAAAAILLTVDDAALVAVV